MRSTTPSPSIVLLFPSDVLWLPKTANVSSIRLSVCPVNKCCSTLKEAIGVKWKSILLNFGFNFQSNNILVIMVDGVARLPPPRPERRLMMRDRLVIIPIPLPRAPIKSPGVDNNIITTTTHLGPHSSSASADRTRRSYDR